MLNTKMVYYSPTGTTKAVLQGIASGIGSQLVELIDITTPESRRSALSLDSEQILLIGVPVYMGRVPDLLKEWFATLQADGTPTVCVVVYGNRAYENALLELSDLVRGRGGKPVAAGAFIGEHSFSDSNVPVALGRPDAEDLSQAALFGRKVREKLMSLSADDSLSTPVIPGTRPYGGITDLWNLDFIDVDLSLCDQCGICSERCPAGAIAATDSSNIDIEKCITCCACIKACPNEARSVKAGPLRDAQQRLMTLHRQPKVPEVFL